MDRGSLFGARSFGLKRASTLAFDHPEVRRLPAFLSRQGELVSESMIGVEPEIRLGSEPRRAERSPDPGGGGRAAFGEVAFVERALAILARQSGPSVAPPPAPASPALAPSILSQVAPSVSAVVGPAISPFLPQAVPPFAPASLAQAMPAAAPSGMFPPSIEVLRKQAVDWIDSLLALVTAGVAPVPVTSNLVAVGAGSAAAPVSSGPPVTAVAAVPVAARGAAGMPDALSTLSTMAASAGQVVAATLRIANDGVVDAPVGFIASDLVGDSGARIPASAITFAPGVAVVAAQAVRAVDVFVAIPEAIPAGTYTGLLQLIGQPLARSLLAVEVKPAPARGQSPTAPGSSIPGARA